MGIVIILLPHASSHIHTRCCLKMSDSYIDKNTYAYYHGSGGAQQSKDGNDTRMEPVYSHKSPKTGVDDEKIKLGEAIQNCESFKTPIRNMRPYGGMYRCRSSGQNRFCDMWCAVLPVGFVFMDHLVLARDTVTVVVLYVVFVRDD